MRRVVLLLLLIGCNGSAFMGDEGDDVSGDDSYGDDYEEPPQCADGRLHDSDAGSCPGEPSWQTCDLTNPPDDCFCAPEVHGSAYVCATCSGELPQPTDRCVPSTQCVFAAFDEYACDCSCNAQGYWACQDVSHSDAENACPSAGRYPDFSAPVQLVAGSFPIGGTTPTLTADGLELVFARYSGDYPPDASAKLELWTTKRTALDQPFATITRENALTTSSGESDPAISPDGLRLLFMRGTTLMQTTRASRAVAWGPASAVTELAGFRAPYFVGNQRALVVQSQLVKVVTFSAITETWSTGVTIFAGSPMNLTGTLDELELFMNGPYGLDRALRTATNLPFSDTINVALAGRGHTLSADGKTMYFELTDYLYSATRP